MKKANLFQKATTLFISGSIYDIDDVARVIGFGLRRSRAYKNAQTMYIDQTMSCDLGEAIQAMKLFMICALTEGKRNGGVRDDSLRAEFLAAYDLYKELKANL